MSRSYKAPWVKDRATRDVKRFANKAWRNKKDVPDGMAYKKYFNSYDICDWRWLVPKPRRGGQWIWGWKWKSYEEMLNDYKKAMRK